MASTLLLDRTAYDLVLDAAGNIAVATEPYSLAQDAGSAIRTFGDGGPNGVGECYWDTSIGIPYLTLVFRGVPPSISTLKQLFVDAALTVPGVASAKCFITQGSNRGISGQIQVTPASGAPPQAANFVVVNPQGGNAPPIPPPNPPLPPVVTGGKLDFTQPGNPLLPGLAGF